MVCESRKLRIPEKLRGRKCSGKCAAGIRKTMNHRRGVNSSMIQTIMKRNGEIVLFDASKIRNAILITHYELCITHYTATATIAGLISLSPSI